MIPSIYSKPPSPCSDLSVSCDCCAVQHKVHFEERSQDRQRILKSIYSIVLRYWILEREVWLIFVFGKLLQDKVLVNTYISEKDFAGI